VSCGRRSALRAADEHKIDKIAFPAISCGVYGFPLTIAAEVMPPPLTLKMLILTSNEDGVESLIWLPKRS
jgi:hypothetical protein